MTKIDGFDFDLPKELIAQFPSEKRDSAQLLVSHESGDLNKANITSFSNLVDLLRVGDLLVFNDSRVVNAKLTLKLKNGNGVNINLNKPISEDKWLGFAKPAKKLKEGDVFHFDEHRIIVSSKLFYGEVELEFDLNKINIFDFLEKYGEVPLPQYIKREDINNIDQIRYQNVYSQHKGSVAAPTAGLHFTQELLMKLKEKGIETAFVTLHVGGGTFLPVKNEHIEDHKMHSEWCNINQETANMINRAKEEGRRVILVGTTSMRTVESCAKNGVVIPGNKETDIFIKPGYKFQIADMLITNFHLPKSTLFMLVCAFSGKQEVKELYQYAINKKMRFFSYGDSMLLKRKE